MSKAPASKNQPHNAAMMITHAALPLTEALTTRPTGIHQEAV